MKPLRHPPSHRTDGPVIADAGIPLNILPTLASGPRPNAIDLTICKVMATAITMPGGKNIREDKGKIRTATMLRGADAALKAIESLQGSDVQVRALQGYRQ